MPAPHTQSLEQIHARERAFWNNAAAEACKNLTPEPYRLTLTDLSDPAMPWLPYMGVPAYVQCLFDCLGDLRGKKVLDIGAGTGFFSVALALRGAQVTSTDIAEQALEIGRYRARASGVEDRIEFKVAASERLDFPSGSFDAVSGLFILHHLDLKIAAPEIRRVLKADGKAAFVETCARNPLLMFFRRTLTGRFGISKASSDDEAPLDESAEAILRQTFGNAVHYHYPELMFFRMGAANVPIFRKQPFMMTMRAVDRALWLVPACRSLSYFVTLELGSSDTRV